LLQAWWNGVMQNGLYVSLSAQVALERRLETIADNVANMTPLATGRLAYRLSR
jgi:flagellar basal body rod protein FlgC